MGAFSRGSGDVCDDANVDSVDTGRRGRRGVGVAEEDAVGVGVVGGEGNKVVSELYEGEGDSADGPAPPKVERPYADTGGGSRGDQSGAGPMARLRAPRTGEGGVEYGGRVEVIDCVSTRSESIC